MKITVCDECDARIEDPALTFNMGDEKPPYVVQLLVRVVDGSTKTSVDLCWECFDRLRSVPCVWREDSNGAWDTSCDNKHEFTVDGPAANQHRFCPYCASVLEEVRYVDIET